MSLLTSLAHASLVSGASSGGSGAVLSASINIVEEGDEVHFTLYVPAGVAGTTYPYTITGISQSDLFYGTLTGNFTLNSLESANLTIILARDDVQEIETITMTVDSLEVSVQVTITDTSPAPVGEQIYDTAGTYQWVCPEGVTSVSAVAIGPGGNGTQLNYSNYTARMTSAGGGGLGFRNNIAVTPGQAYTVKVGSPGISDSYFMSSVTARGGYGRNGKYIFGTITASAGGTYTGDGGGNGGSSPAVDSSIRISGGGGAGGWSSSGGNGGYSNLTAGNGLNSTTGGAGGASGYWAYAPGYSNDYGGYGGKGGGQNIYGAVGSTTLGGIWEGSSSNGNTGNIGGSYAGGNYGAGGRSAAYKGSPYSVDSLAGGSGAVRIMWGPDRSFPNNAEYREFDATPTATQEYSLLSLNQFTDDSFGWSTALSGRYMVVGNNAGYGRERVEVFDVTNGQSLYTLTGSNKFGNTICMEGKYLVVSDKDAAHPANGVLSSGAVYVYDVTTGELLHTMTRPDPPTASNDWYGTSIGISGVHMIVGSERIPSPTAGGRVYIYELVNGSLLHTIDNPNIEANDAFDAFGSSVAMSGNYAIVGARLEDRYEGGFVSASGNAYIINVTTGAVIKVLDNPNAPGTSADADQFGYSVAMSGNYAIVGAYTEDLGGASSGSVYIFKTTSGDWSDASLIHSIHNPTTGDATSDFFGMSVAISGNYAIVGAYGSESGTYDRSGKVYIFDVVSGTLVLEIPNPVPWPDEFFGRSVAISGNYVGIGMPGQAAYVPNNTYTNAGGAYIYKLT